MEIFERVNRLSSFGAGWVLWVLIALSVVGVALIIERSLYLVSSRDDLEKLIERLSYLLASGEVGAAERLLAASPSFEARIAKSGLDADNAGAAEERMAAESQLSRLRMEKHLAFLGTVGNNAPFVGLLGTVIGIVRAFQALDASGGQVSAGLMAEIGEALGATAVGLLVALPAVACYNLFQRVIQARLARGDALGRHVLAHLKSARRDRVEA
jgi:biopolymer transport protein ExbB/TolQ